MCRYYEIYKKNVKNRYFTVHYGIGLKYNMTLYPKKRCNIRVFFFFIGQFVFRTILKSRHTVAGVFEITRSLLCIFEINTQYY